MLLFKQFLGTSLPQVGQGWPIWASVMYDGVTSNYTFDGNNYTVHGGNDSMSIEIALLAFTVRFLRAKSSVKCSLVIWHCCDNTLRGGALNGRRSLWRAE